MQRMRNMWLMAAVILLAATLLAPGLGQAQPKPKGPPPPPPPPQHFRAEAIAKDLGLTPEKTRAFLEAGDKYGPVRQRVIDDIRRNERELTKALAEPKPNAARIKGLVTTLTADHDKLLHSFQAQRRDEIDLLNPIQQGKYLIALKKWHEKMCVKYEKQEKKK